MPEIPPVAPPPIVVPKLAKVALIASRFAYEPFKVPALMTHAADQGGQASAFAIDGATHAFKAAVDGLQPRGPAKWLSQALAGVAAANVNSIKRGQHNYEVIWVPLSKGSLQIGDAVGGPGASYYAAKAGYPNPADAGLIDALLRKVDPQSDPANPSPAKYPTYVKPAPKPAPTEPAPAPNGTPPTEVPNDPNGAPPTQPGDSGTGGGSPPKTTTSAPNPDEHAGGGSTKKSVAPDAQVATDESAPPTEASPDANSKQPDGTPAEPAATQATPTDVQPTNEAPPEAKPADAKPADAKTPDSKPTAGKPPQGSTAEIKNADGTTAGRTTTSDSPADASSTPPS